MAIKDISGQRFGRLTAIAYTGRKTEPGGNSIWLFKCDCGNYVERPNSNVTCVSKVPSCGCYIRERAGNLNKTHGGRHERLYLVWMDMRRRCYDKKDSNYSNYGGRGITVCEEWKDYAKFREWAISTGYNKEAKRQSCTIDRIDSNDSYTPENCRWADSVIQNNNKKNNIVIEYKGKKQTLPEWSRELGFKYSLVLKRLSTGWDFERAITQEPRVCKKRDCSRLCR